MLMNFCGKFHYLCFQDNVTMSKQGFIETILWIPSVGFKVNLR